MGIDLNGPPQTQQLISFVASALGHWVLGFVFQYWGRDLHEFRRDTFPRLVRWACGMFNPQDALDRTLVYVQLGPMVTILPSIFISGLSLCFKNIQ
jgi:hypothetical protein